MSITRYATKSGSIYDVCAEASEGPGSIRRVKLGDRHRERGGDAAVARRLADLVGNGEWKPFIDHYIGGVGDRMQFKFHDEGGGVMTTSPIVESCVFCDTEELN